uniref:Ig-like domain-containing protein n=1 Tax=Paramormyrops kingsleyae TaxID=1676925 RepID=A0A3B3RFJ6_9TELE
LHAPCTVLTLYWISMCKMADADSVYTVSRVSAWRGGSVTIPCFYDDIFKTHVKYWCRGRQWSSCPPIVHSDSPQEGKVSIRDDPDQQVFTVTINSLTAGDSGTYFCGVNISGGSDVGDHVSLSVTDGKMSVLQTVCVEFACSPQVGSCSSTCLFEWTERSL